MVDWQSESDLDSLRNSCDVFILRFAKTSRRTFDSSTSFLLWKHTLWITTGPFETKHITYHWEGGDVFCDNNIISDQQYIPQPLLWKTCEVYTEPSHLTKQILFLKSVQRFYAGGCQDPLVPEAAAATPAKPDHFLIKNHQRHMF